MAALLEEGVPVDGREQAEAEHAVADRDLVGGLAVVLAAEDLVGVGAPRGQLGLEVLERGHRTLLVAEELHQPDHERVAEPVEAGERLPRGIPCRREPRRRTRGQRSVHEPGLRRPSVRRGGVPPSPRSSARPGAGGFRGGPGGAWWAGPRARRWSGVRPPGTPGRTGRSAPRRARCRSGPPAPGPAHRREDSRRAAATASLGNSSS